MKRQLAMSSLFSVMLGPMIICLGQCQDYEGKPIADWIKQSASARTVENRVIAFEKLGNYARQRGDESGDILNAILAGVGDASPGIRIVASSSLIPLCKDRESLKNGAPDLIIKIVKSKIDTTEIPQSKRATSAGEAKRGERIRFANNVIVILGSIGQKDEVTYLKKIAEDQKAILELRYRAIDAIVNIGGEDAKKSLEEIKSVAKDPAFRKHLDKHLDKLDGIGS